MNIKGSGHLCKLMLVSILMFIIYKPVFAQTTNENNNYTLNVEFVEKDSGKALTEYKFQTSFATADLTIAYILKLPQLLASMGYPVASVDSVWQIDRKFNVLLFTGTKYNLVELNTSKVDKQVLEASGYNARNYINQPFSTAQLQQLQQRMLSYYEKNGYPFAAVYLDSLRLEADEMRAMLAVDKGVLYHIDSIRLYGKVKLNKKFLQRYLGISNGSIYNKQLLEQVDKRLLELTFLTPVQPSDLTMLGTGSVLNVYADPRKSSQVNFLIGFLPAAGTEKKLQLTGDINLNLKNMFSGGEEILIKWQQLQVKSPRLNLGFTQPYIFSSPFGINFIFDLFKKDSNFLQVNAQVGAQYNLSASQNGKLFLQWQNNILLAGGVDTNQVKLQKQLPPNIDVSASNVGLDYELLATNYRYNPRRGNEINFTGIVGIKNIKKNNDIVSIKDPSYNYESLYDSIKSNSYQLRLKIGGAHYFPLTQTATLKTALHGGYYSSPNIFRNELFQIGGYRLLRGFNEESIYASRYAVFTAEYRYLVGLNSYLFAFTDLGWVKNKYQDVNINNNFIGAGLGISYETKAGLLNVSYAIGKRDDIKFNIREASKLHFGYINYF